MALPVPGYVTQMQTNMAAALNIDWALRAGGRPDGGDGARGRLLRSRRRTSSRGWRRRGRGRCSIIPTSPRRASAGRSSTPTRGPGSSGCRAGTAFPDLVRAVVEGLGFAARDCYAAMGELPARAAADRRARRGRRRCAAVLGGGGAGAGAGLGPRGGGRGRGGDDGGGGGRRLSVDGRLHRALGDAASRAGRGAGPGAGRGSTTGCSRPTSARAARWRRSGRRWPGGAETASERSVA